MHCHDLDTLMGPYGDGELAAGERVGVEEHLAQCSACAQTFEARRHNLSLVRAAIQEATPPAPAVFKARLLEGLDAEETRLRRRRTWRTAALAATVAGIAVLGHHQWRTFQRRLYFEDAAQRHARHYPMEIDRPSPEQLEAFFGGKLDHRVAAPRFLNATASGARLLHVREKPAAYIKYDAAPSRQLGLFVFGDDARDVDVGPLPDPDLDTSHGYNVVSWRDGDVVYELVTDLDEADIRTLLPGPPGAPARAQPPALAPSPPSPPPPALAQPTRPVLDVRPASMQR